jgi:hypothetical protein
MPDTFGLLFQSRSEGLKAGVGTGTHAYVCLSTTARCEAGHDKIFLSRQCLSVQELRQEIDRLQKELEQLWHVGRRRFSEFEELRKSQIERAAS